jgi:hypothetical protein
VRELVGLTERPIAVSSIPAGRHMLPVLGD